MLSFISTVDRPSHRDLTSFLEVVVTDPSQIAKLAVSAPYVSGAAMRPLVFGENLFLQRPDLEPPSYVKDHQFKSRELELVALPCGLVLPRSLLIVADGGYVYEGSSDWSRPKEDRLRIISSFDPSIVINDVGAPSLSSQTVTRHSEKVAVPICGPGMPNFGHFLYDGLPVALAIRQSPAFSDNITFVGPPLRPWQRNLMERLNLLNNYTPITDNTSFRSVIAHTMLYGHLAFPSRFLHLPFELLRIQVGAETRQNDEKIFLSRGSDRKRLLVNRDEVEECLKQRGFRVIEPAIESLESVIAALAACRYVIGESGAGLANVGFCNLGTKVLEIQPTGFPETYTRSTCAVFGLRWHVYIVEAVGCDQHSSADDQQGGICYTADIPKLMDAVDCIDVSL